MVVVNSLRLWIAAGLVALVPGRVALLGQVDGTAWALAAGAALSGPEVSRLLMMLGLRHISAAMSTLVLFATPVFAFLLGDACRSVYNQVVSCCADEDIGKVIANEVVCGLHAQESMCKTGAAISIESACEILSTTEGC